MMQRRMVSILPVYQFPKTQASLSEPDYRANVPGIAHQRGRKVRGDEVEVRREDQDRINKFSRLSSREQVLEEELKVKAKEKEELDDVSMELELADEDETVPYKIGDAFYHVKLEQAQEMLEKASERIDKDVARLRDDISSIQDQMTQLKVELYARFGKSINLEK
ncbi:unnamed protein product [Parascedosporium putredinis]|uniref:Prefoldin subunit 4 n=1 Tax=Parascedosporium putredinis TaxID=1442378 RepID=A0A9P1MBW2_9PEZI|nr:unnamed protein product [Parascedosporium putredinis]CAI7999487.1 unnamed protein product [Parascedosporium putredinis]